MNISLVLCFAKSFLIWLKKYILMVLSVSLALRLLSFVGLMNKEGIWWWFEKSNWILCISISRIYVTLEHLKLYHTWSDCKYNLHHRE